MTGIPSIDDTQLYRIESVHRGFLYQHLFAVGCLLLGRTTRVEAIVVERDEDVEVVLPTCRLYVQVKTRANTVGKSDLDGFYSRVEYIRRLHAEGSRPGEPTFWLAANVAVSNGLVRDLQKRGIELLSPEHVSTSPEHLPPPWQNLNEALDWCTELASDVPFSRLTPETLVWKLSALVSWACTGPPERSLHEFRVDELPVLCEQIVTQLQAFPDTPVPYRTHDQEPPFETETRIRLITGFSGAGKTAWASEGSLHALSPVAYFDVVGLPDTAVAASLARDLGAQLQEPLGLDLGEVLMPGTTALDTLRALSRCAARAETVRRPVLVIDNVHLLHFETIRQVIVAAPDFTWILLGQPWPGQHELEATFQIQAEELHGWPLQAVASEFSKVNSSVNPPTAERIRTLTGGLPLFVRNAALLTSQHYACQPAHFCEDVQSATNTETTAQQAILSKVIERLTDRARCALSVFALCDVPLTGEEGNRLLAASLEIEKSGAAALLRDLQAWGIVQASRTGDLKLHDAFRSLAVSADGDSGVAKHVSLAQSELASILQDSFSVGRVDRVDRLVLYCRLLPKIGQTQELLDIVSGLSEELHEHGRSGELMEILTNVAGDDGLSDQDRFLALDTMVFWDYFDEHIEIYQRRIEEMEAILERGRLGSEEHSRFAQKVMMLHAKRGDSVGVETAFQEALTKNTDSNLIRRVLRYNYAVANLLLDHPEKTVDITTELIPEYYHELGLDLEDVLLKNPHEIVEALGQEVHLDEIKRLADCLDLHARSRNKLFLDGGLARIHAHKFYVIANALTSAMKVGMDFVDEILVRFGDVKAARDFIEQSLLRLILDRHLVGYLVPVKAQYAVVLAYCGEIGQARRLIAEVREFAALTETAKAELDNQKSLIDQIAAGQQVVSGGAGGHAEVSGRPRKVGRNEPCPCGSGRKFKKCCGR